MFSITIWLALLATQAVSHDQHADHVTHAGHGTRQTQVATRGATVMPFDLDRTTHAFQPLADGGAQTITSDDGAPEQVALIRGHLREEAAAFSMGDYASPAAIHGRDMPGLAELTAGSAQVHVSYEETRNGARLRFTTADAGLVAAVHRWFAAQRSDHGKHVASD